MKKLNLKNLTLEVSDLLEREQLKTVFGGYSGMCQSGMECDYDSDCPGSCHCDTSGMGRHQCR